MIIRVVVDLPFVPLMLTTGMWRSASRIHGGGCVPASRIAPSARASVRLGRAWREVGAGAEIDREIGEPVGALGDRLRAAAFTPRESHDPVARLGRPVDATGIRGRRPLVGAATLGSQPLRRAGIAMQSLDPRRDIAHRRTVRSTVARARTQLHHRVSARRPRSVPAATSPNGDLDLDRRLEAVDVRSFEQADLDQAHGGRV